MAVSKNKQTKTPKNPLFALKSLKGIQDIITKSNREDRITFLQKEAVLA